MRREQRARCEEERKHGGEAGISHELSRADGGCSQRAHSSRMAGASLQFAARFQIVAAARRKGCEEPPSTLPRRCGRCGCHPELRACCRLPQAPRSCGLALRRRRERRSCMPRLCQSLSTTRAARSDLPRRGYGPVRPGQLQSCALPSLARPSINARFRRSHFRQRRLHVHAAAATRAAIRGGAAAICRRAAGAARCERGAGAGAGHRARVDLARAIGAVASRGDGAADARAARRSKKRGGRAFHTVTVRRCMCMRHDNSSVQYIKTQRPRHRRPPPPPAPPPPPPSSTRSLRGSACAIASRDPRRAPTRPRRGRRCQTHSDHRGTC